MTEACAEPAGAIRAIDRHSVHQICSGQVVLTLATAVKELVENSIDAGATNVDIRLKDHGTELVEVSDNGRGVEEKNFEGLTLKHHTSKLRDFSDLIHVETFGFRGEALSSLCALSDLSVVTCHESSNVGTRLVYDHDGHLVQRVPHPRQQGTTVSLQQLFSTLPVRHKEFQRNIKKEYSKMIHVLQSYCIISTGVRITCTNQIGQGKRSMLLGTSGSHSMRDNIGALFGPKQLQSLIPFQQTSPTDSIKDDYGLSGAELPKDLFTICGYLSQADHGVGRSATDRQFFFINKRPCDPSKVSKIVNEVYHMFNRHQYPFVALNISVASECVDVNVTPDKRQIFLQEEKLLLAILKSSLIAIYETGVNRISLNNTTQLSSSFCRPTDFVAGSEGHHTVILPEASPKDDSDALAHTSKPSFNLAGLKAAFSKHQAPGTGTKTFNYRPVCNGPTQKKMQSFFHCSEKANFTRPSVGSPSSTSSKHAISSLKASTSCLSKYKHESDMDAESKKASTGTSETCVNGSEFSPLDSVLGEPNIKAEPYSEPPCLETSELETKSMHSPERIFSPEAKKFKWDNDFSEQGQVPSTAPGDISSGLFDRPVNVQKKTLPLHFSMIELARRMERLRAQQKEQHDQEPKYRRFRAKINPGENQSAEDELKKEISKDMFKEMEIIGQFNLGFIITKFKSDLFMIDQHATDEKYNFEMLQQHTVLKGQRLIVPQNLHLTAVSETILIENLEIFKKNGFDFLIDEDAPVMERVKLVSLPTSKNWTFGPTDIEELIFMLSDSPGVMCRPSRVRQMFASRACRKSLRSFLQVYVSEMAKGGKREKPDGATSDNVPNTLTGNCSRSSLDSEFNGDQEAAAEPSEQPVTVSSPPQHREDQEGLQTPVLANIIVQRYEGERRGKLFHGEGAAVFQGGHQYKVRNRRRPNDTDTIQILLIHQGSFAEGLMHGHGEYIWADGIKYEGVFVSNALIGHGVYTWLDGSTYEGQVFYGIRHGIGTYKCARTSSVYKGQWNRGKRHGQGTIYYNQELTSWYEGDWKNNHREGWGVRCYPSGCMYQGQWKDNMQHGEGTMRWFQLGQQFTGHWVNGIQQHGQGTYTWFLRRVLGSQYPLRNEYKGEFVQGLRHGQGTFFYASGAVYSGEWKHNQKHGQGKFVFKNGCIFEGEFINDRMAEFPAFSIDGAKTPDLSGIRTHSPPTDENDLPRRAKNASMLGSDIALNIEALLNRIPAAQRDQELREVEFAITRHIALLRTIYSFYSSLGHDQSPDNTFLLTRLQFWQFLKDCGVHLHGITLSQMDRLIDEDTSTKEVHSPFSTVLLRNCLSYVVIAAYYIYHENIGTSKNILVGCFSKLMKQNIIPNAKNVKGRLFCHPLRAVIANTIDRCWELFQVFCKAKNTGFSNQTMKARHFIWMLMDLGLLDNELTTARVLETLSLENPAIYNTSHSNLDLEITFLEFFEALLGCAEVKAKDSIRTSEHFHSTSDHPPLSKQALSQNHMSINEHTCYFVLPQYESPTESSNLNIVSGNGLAKTLEVGPVLSDQEIDSTSKMATLNSAGRETESNKEDSKQSSMNTDPAEVVRPEEELERWIKTIDQFFTQTFFPAYEHNLLLKEEMQEEWTRQITKNRLALEKAQGNAGLREQREAEQNERRKTEEKEDAGEEKGNVPDDKSMMNRSPPALVTTVAFYTSDGLRPPPPK
ncbi:hypothetical protein NFI96_012347 [Prochilodus magdalenae]|nr:hypothetical protein NFI96_012347 [Prochilodus magdalenae]